MAATVKFFIFAHGNVVRDEEGASYDRDPLRKIRVQTDASYEDLVNAICARINIDQTTHQITVHYRHPKCVEGRVYFSLVPICDDTDVEDLVEMAEKMGEEFIQELYIEIFERSISLFEHEMHQADTMIPLSPKAPLSKHDRTVQNEDFMPKRARYDIHLPKEISIIHREMNSVPEDPPTEMGKNLVVTDLRYENPSQNVMIHKLDYPVASLMSPSQMSMDITNGMEEDNQTLRASSSTTPPPAQDYEVFLSFRGIDTRHGFTDHLYNELVNEGVLVFRDDNELRVGKEIGLELLKAIKASRISIPIISKNYASSSWCLRELVQILECMKKSSQVMLPIFYQVEPSEVRNQTGDFGKGFLLCKNKHYDEESLIQEWKNALGEVASLKGWESSKIANGHEGELIRVIVHEVLQVLIGDEDHVQKIIKRITNAKESNDAQAIVIHGMDGIGKTTLAKLLYNRLCNHFEHCSFLANICATSKQHKGIEDLQKQLISNILGQQVNISCIDEGVTIIKARCNRKKVLMLLDDVDHKDQLDALVGKLDWFGRGTVIIITSRRKDLFENWEDSISYELNELNPNQSFMLFCKHAFKRSDSIPDEYNSIAKEIVSTTGGLPLVIEVIGSLLYGKAKSFWEENLKILKKIPRHKVQMKLKISLDALEEEEKEIFLDVACLHIYDKDRRELAFRMWDSCGFCPQVRIGNLISLSLIKSGENGELIIHDQLRDLGREVVRQESIDDPGQHSRIWKEEDALEVLELNKGTPKVQALILQPPYDIHSTSQQFEKMANLRYLLMNKVHLHGDFKHLFPNLKWFEWFSTWGNISDIMGINFNPKKLVALNLSGSNITEHWQGWSQLKCLKVLKLDRCPYMTTTPNFLVLNQLEVLTVNYCNQLRAIHPSIGKLSKTLEVLDVKYCNKLEELPIEVGKMEVLKHLDISYTPIREIPIFEGHMTKLERLLATSCHQLLYISDSLGSLVKLQHLDLWECKSLTKIPMSIGNLKLLIELDLGKTGVKNLPNSIGALCSLEQLVMSRTPIKCLPASIGILSKLQKLDLEDCKELESPSNLPSSLTSLCFSGDSMDELPDFSHLTNLNHLTYRDLFERRSRELNLGKLNQLMTLWIQCSDIWDYDLEEEIKISNPVKEVNTAPENFNLLLELPGSLHELCITGCLTLHALPNLSNFKNLYELYLQDCSELMQINGLEGVESLKILVIERCQKLLKLGDLSHLKMLTKLRLCDCKKLSNVQGIEKLTSLTILSYSGCHSDIKFPDLSMLRNLKELEVGHEGLMKIPGLQELKYLEKLKIFGCKSLQYLDFSQLTNLENLDIQIFEKITKIRGLKNLKSLRSLIFRGYTAFKMNIFDPLEGEMESKIDSYPFEAREERKSETHTNTPGLENSSLREADMRGCTLARKLPTLKFMECLHQKMKKLGIEISAMDGDVMQVNDNGNIFIPIFSERFVSSATCISMLESWRKSTDTHILPIFFAVEPSDVSLQTPLFKQSLSELHETFKDDKLVNQWTDALIEVTNIRGWSVPEIYGSEEIDKQANSVCEMVLQKLKWIQLSMGNCLVGIDHHVDRILNLLDLEVNDVQAVWIWGQDGVGKTTLARAVYRQLCSGFEASCFIEEIDERARHPNGGIQFLQAKMVSDLLNREMEVMEDKTDGIKLISERFCHMKVLIVLDDVTDHSHLEDLAEHLYWFGPGSRIIITARQECFMKVNPPAPNYKISFDLSEEHENTLQLFSMHAFRRTDPLEDFDLLSREFVRILDPHRGLPLSIEILGSFLHGKSVAEWISELQSLKGYSQNYVDTEKIISMSYESLSEKQKQIFLDISCFPHGIDSRIVTSFCHGSHQSPSVDDFEVLILLSLVKVDNNKGIWMHRLLRDFGRKNVDSINWQEQKRSTKEVEASDSHTSSELTLMHGIKFLKLYEENIYSDFDRVFARLRGLEWQRCSSEFHLCFENVIVLDFSWCKNWTGCHQIEASKLRVLNLTGCTGLLETPDFSTCQNLEMLILEHCSRLVRIGPSIQHLQHLATLTLKNCTELNVLPNEVGRLEALKELHLDGTSIQDIPILIGNLKNLQILTASKCFSLDQLPQTTYDLVSLTELKLDFTNITELPCSIWERMKLQHLSLGECRGIKSLPPFDGDVESSLKELDLSRTSISELPSSIVKLKNLSVLKVDFSFISEFPPDFGKLKNLEEIHASWCRNLEYLPEDIDKLVSLKVFKVGHSTISSIPKSIQLLTSLETLDCTSCDKLQSLPELPSSLTTLNVQLTELKTLPDLVNLKRLREFTLESSNLRILGLNLPQIRDLPTLPDSLRKLSLCCAKLKDMTRLPSKLVVLSLQGCCLLTKLPTMKSLQNLLEMEILHCPKIKKIEGLGGLKALRSLKISNCRVKSLDELDKLTSLTKLTLQDCRLLGNLCVKSLQNLMELEILGCPEIEKIEGLEGLRKLRTLLWDNHSFNLS